MTRKAVDMLPLRRRAWPSLPYPSWPVPAAGPFRGGLSFFSVETVGAASDMDLFLRLKSGNRVLKDVETLGLGVRFVLGGSVLAV